MPDPSPVDVREAFIAGYMAGATHHDGSYDALRAEAEAAWAVYQTRTRRAR